MNITQQAFNTSLSSDGEIELLKQLRPLVLHYHLFKNAGSSVDEMLIRNFGTLWTQAEFKTPVGNSNTEDVANYLLAHPNIVAFSSHTAYLPPPQLPGLYIFPIIFVRHPLDRIKSAYSFEKSQGADTYGAKLARRETFEGYLRHLLNHPTDRTVRNFQSHRFAHNEPPSVGSESRRALLALESLPFVGLVEAFERSLQRLERRLQPLFQTFRAYSAKENVTRNLDKPLQVRLDEIEQEIGKPLFAELCAANANDIELFRRVERNYQP